LQQNDGESTDESQLAEKLFVHRAFPANLVFCTKYPGCTKLE
jgi:hypothetical protein